MILEKLTLAVLAIKGQTCCKPNYLNCKSNLLKSHMPKMSLFLFVFVFVVLKNGVPAKGILLNCLSLAFNVCFWHFVDGN